MIWLLGGYMWLYVHRPFEIYHALGEVQFERGYMFFMMLVWLVHPNKGFVANRIHVGLAAFTFALLAAWVMSPYANKPGCLDIVESYAKVGVFYAMVVTTVRDAKQLRLLVLLFLAGTGLYMLHSLWEYVGGRIQWRMGISRMIGVDVTYSDPNAFASTLLYTLPLLLPFWREKPRRIARPLVLAYAAVALFCILRTGSRAGFAGTALLTLIVIVTSAQRKGQAMLLTAVAGMIAFAVLTVVLPEELQNRYLTLVDSSRGPANAQVSADGRLDGFLHGMSVWQQSPLVGHGPGSFAFSTGREGQAHNLYGQVMSEMGLLGGLALLGMVVCYLANWRESRRLAAAAGVPADDVSLQIAQAVGINVVLLLVMGWAGHNLFRYNWQWFAAFTAVAAHCLRLRLAAATQAEAAWQQAEAQLAWQ